MQEEQRMQSFNAKLQVEGAEPEPKTDSIAQQTQSDSGLITLGKRLAPQKTLPCNLISKKPKRENFNAYVTQESADVAASYDQVQVATTGDRPRSQTEQVPMVYQLETIEKHEISEGKNTELLNQELIYDDEDSDTRRERR